MTGKTALKLVGWTALYAVIVLWLYQYSLAKANQPTPIDQITSVSRESASEKRERLQREARQAVVEAAQKSVVGFRRIVDTNFRDAEDNPARWTAQVKAEFINGIGGVGETNLSFRFEPVAGSILCVPVSL